MRYLTFNGQVLVDLTSLIHIGDQKMFLAIAGVLFVLWLLGFLAFHVAGAFIHILLVLAVIAIIWHFVAGRKVA